MNDINITVMRDTQTLVITKDGKQETYPLHELSIPESSLVVAYYKQEILQQLKIDHIETTFKIAAALLAAIYKMLAGTMLQSTLSGLQKALLDVSKDCLVAWQMLNTKTAEFLTTIYQAYKLLYKGQSRIALKKISIIDEEKTALFKTITNLNSRFMALADAVLAALQNNNSSSQETSTSNDKISKINNRSRSKSDKKYYEIMSALVAHLSSIQKALENTAETDLNTLTATIFPSVAELFKYIGNLFASQALVYKSLLESPFSLKAQLMKLNVAVQEDNIEKLKASYSEPAFIFDAVKDLANWIALQDICQESLQTMEKLYGTVVQNINEAPTIEAAKEQAPALIGQLLNVIQRQMQASLSASKQS